MGVPNWPGCPKLAFPSWPSPQIGPTELAVVHGCPELDIHGCPELDIPNWTSSSNRTVITLVLGS